MAKKEVAAKAKKVKTAKAKKPMTKNELLHEADELLTKIEGKVEEQKQARYRVDSARDEYKAAKGELANRTSELERLANARKEKHPLFELPKDSEKKKEPEQPLLAGDWKGLPLSGVGLKPKHLKAIEDHGIKTIGAFQQHVFEQGDWWAKQIGGLGEVGAQEVSDALADFWGNNPQYCDGAAKEADVDVEKDIKQVA